MATVKDPICGKDVDTLRARAVGIFGGVTYYFCSQECKSKYVDPRKTPRAPSPPAPDATKPMPIAAQAKPIAAQAKAAKANEPRKDPSLEELPPMKQEAGGDDEPLPDLTPAAPRPTPSPSVIADLREVKQTGRKWTWIVVILAALVVAAAVLSLRN